MIYTFERAYAGVVTVDDFDKLKDWFGKRVLHSLKLKKPQEQKKGKHDGRFSWTGFRTPFDVSSVKLARDFTAPFIGVADEELTYRFWHLA